MRELDSATAFNLMEKLDSYYTVERVDIFNPNDGKHFWHATIKSAVYKHYGLHTQDSETSMNIAENRVLDGTATEDDILSVAELENLETISGIGELSVGEVVVV